MLLKEIKDEVIIGRSGQFILEPENLEIDDSKFLILVRSCLRKYNRHSPAHGKTNITASGTSYLFLEADSIGIPDWIAAVLPLASGGSFGAFHHTHGSHNSNVWGPELVKRKFTWEYRTPTLYLPYSGTFDVTWVRNHRVTQNDNEQNQIASFGVDGTDEDTFFALLTGRFLQTIGRFRRAFTIGEIPITMDASELVSDGLEMATAAEDDLTENQAKFYLAGWGN